jgi:hypothetical protein
MGREVVHRGLDRYACEQLLKVTPEQLGLEAVRVIEIDAHAIGQGQVSEISVVPIVPKDRSRVVTERAHDLAHDGRLARTRTTCDPEDHGACLHLQALSGTTYMR